MSTSSIIRSLVQYIMVAIVVPLGFHSGHRSSLATCLLLLAMVLIVDCFFAAGGGASVTNKQINTPNAAPSSNAQSRVRLGHMPLRECPQKPNGLS